MVATRTATARTRRSTKTSPARKRPQPTRGRLRALPNNYKTPAARRKRARRLLLAGSTAVLLLLFGLVISHVALTQGQFDLEKLEQRIDKQEEKYAQLRVQVAQLEAPDRIIAEAKARLGMQTPATVQYVSPQGTLTSQPELRSDQEGSDDSWARVKRLRAEQP